MTALEFLKHRRDRGHVPTSKEGNGLGPPSNSELRRWLDKKSVLINGRKPRAKEEVSYPITQLQFFPGSRHQTTVRWGDWWAMWEGKPDGLRVFR